MKKARPMVAMNSVISGWLTSGRSTTRSMARPSSTITAIVTGSAEPQRQAEAVDEADEGQRGEEHHRALREVEHAGGLVDQHEAERDQRVHHARQQAADQHFEKEIHTLRSGSQWATPR